MNHHVGTGTIFDIFAQDLFESEVAEGYVTLRRHPSLPYTIANYAPHVQFENRWNIVTEWCRGLIFDDNYKIIARSWKKFYNLGQVDLPIQFDTPVEVMDKADGSLGILYPVVVDTPEVFDMVYGVATRGSFESEQSQFATKLWNEKYHNYDPLPGYTMLFEIIAPFNRIVLDYGDMEDLILLGAVENGTGYYVGPKTAMYLWTERGHGTPMPSHWPGPVVEIYEYNTISDALQNMGRPNKEGYVIRSHNFMVKVKEPEYLDLHKLVTNASPKTVWEQLRAGKSKSEIISNFPDEFHDYIGSMVDPLLEAYDKRLAEIMKGYDNASRNLYREFGGTMTRKACANEFKKSKDAKYFFLLLDNRSIRQVLWAELKPRETAIERIENG